VILRYASSATIGGQSTSDGNAYRGTFDELVAPGWKKENEMNLTDKVGSKIYPNRTVEDLFSDFGKERDVLWGDGTGAKVAGMLAGLTPERLSQALVAADVTPATLAAALPADLAEQLADLLAQRLAGG
jgi:hypothetical protein